MKLVCAGFGRDVENPAARSAIFRGERTSGRAKLLNRLDADSVDEDAAPTGRREVGRAVFFAEAHIHAVEKKIVAERRGAVEFNTAPAADAARGRVHHAGLEAQQLLEVPAVQRQFFDAGFIDDGSQFRGRGIHQRRGRIHLDRLRYGADLKLQVDSGARTGIQVELAAYRFLESLSFGFQLVPPCRKQWELIIAEFIGVHRLRLVRGEVAGGHLNGRYNRSAGVFDDSDDRSSADLPAGSRSEYAA